MLSSVEQAFVGREEIRAPLKMPAWEAIKTPDNEWVWVKTNHLPPQEEAWHWLTRQMVQQMSVVS